MAGNKRFVFVRIWGVYTIAVGFMSAIEREVAPVWHSLILITTEVSFILLTITFASSIASEIFGVRLVPGLRFGVNKIK